MARANKQAGSDEGPGAPEWMVTFSDCMTLLLTFFVLLLSFSSFDDNRAFRHLRVIYSKAFTRIAPSFRIERESMLYLPPVKYISELDEGSETITSEEGIKDGFMNEAKMTNLISGVALLIPSKKVFWANGSAFSPEGLRIMDTIAPFLRESPSRIVISENGPTNNQAGEYFGLPRAWVVMEYLTKEKNLDSDSFSISAEGILAKRSLGNGRPDSGLSETERTVEIVLLQRSIYN